MGLQCFTLCKAMTKTGGTAIFNWTPDEYQEFLQNEVQQEFSMNVIEFSTEFYNGKLDTSDPGVASTASMLCLDLNKKK